MIDELTEAFARERRRTASSRRRTRRSSSVPPGGHELVARLGHELRTPVTVVLGMAQTLAEVRRHRHRGRSSWPLVTRRATELARLVERFEIAVDADLTERVDVVERARAVAEPPSARTGHPGAGSPEARPQSGASRPGSSRS